MQSSQQDTTLSLFLLLRWSSAVTKSVPLLFNAWVLLFTFSWMSLNVHVDDVDNNMNQWVRVILFVWTCHPKILKRRLIDLHQAFKFPWKQKVIMYKYLIHLIKLVIKSYCHISVFHSDICANKHWVELSKIEIYVMAFFLFANF